MSETALVHSLPPGEGPALPGPGRLVGVQFRRAAAIIYDFEAGDLALAHDTRVVVETERGEALGWTVGAPDAREPHGEGPVRRVLRIATEQDLAKDRDHHAKERDALRHCAERARQLGLPMKVIAAEWAHSADKVTFYFSSEDRVDFRNLVRELAQRHRMRVEMRQVGPRDEAKIIGAIGPCGRETCCSSWMRAFAPVSIKMAKDQGLALNPQKVTGVCGRLLCCLAYEQETYKELRKGLPKWGKMVVTPRGTGKVIDVLTLRRKVRVSIDDEWIEFAVEEVRPLGAPGADDHEDEREEGEAVPGAEAKAPATSNPSLPASPPKGERADSPPRRDERPRHENRPRREDRPRRDERPPRPEARPEAPKERPPLPTGERPGEKVEKPERPENRPNRPDRRDNPRAERPPDRGPKPPERANRPENKPNPPRPPGDRPPRQDPRPPRDQRPPQPRPPRDQRPPQPRPDAPKPVDQGESQAPAEANQAGEQKPNEPRDRPRHRRNRGGGGHGGGTPPSTPNQPPPTT